MMPVQTVRTPTLDVAYLESGPVDGSPVVLLHGFPYDVHAYDECAAQLAGDGRRVIVPYLRGYGPTRFLEPTTMRSGQQGALAADLLDLLDALRIEAATLVGYDWGGRAACIVAALWPDRVSGLVTGDGYNIQDIAAASAPLPPEQERRFWYQHYFNAERGPAGLTRHRDPLCRLLWSEWSPTWVFDDATFAKSAESFTNPDFVDIVIHSYRHRYGRVAGDQEYDDIEQRLAGQPPIGVPSIVLYGGDDGVGPPPAPGDPRGDIAQFLDLVDENIIPGVGHNFPQEAPDAVVAAVRALAPV
jgi:pimeloyl-ACP methyl ester carboxylesterase